MNSKLQYAMKNNELVYIGDVDNGLKCGCTCASCGQTLVAKKGKIKIHHFAHFDSEECKGALETSLHMLAKEILAEEKCIKLPPVYLSFSPESYKNDELIYEEKMIRFDKVYLEKKIDNIVPDIVVEVKDSKLLVEIYVTHDIDEVKLSKIESMNISTLLIDLSSLDHNISKDTLRELLIDCVDNKKWIYNKREREIYRRFRAKARPFEDAEKGDGTFCPQYLYGYKGVSSARWADCVHCEYCFSISGEVNCLGYSGVSKIADLNNPSLREIAINLKKENKIQPAWLEETRCTVCRQGFMKFKNGKNGNFLGCSKYPNCRNTIKI